MSDDFGSRPKNARKPQPKTRVLWDAILAVCADYEHLTVRQLFYQLVARGCLPKTEAAYKRVGAASVQMRLAGELPFRAITDGHRERRKTATWNGVGAVLEDVHGFYHRDYWRDQAVHVEVWCEKDALTGIIKPVCDRFGVQYVATRGFASVSLFAESAFAMRASGKPTDLIYFGDHDPSGQHMSTVVSDWLRYFDAPFTLERVALEPDQIARYGLPTRPGKQSDSRYAAFTARFGDASVELDALPPDVLTAMVEESIRARIEPTSWNRMREIEEAERRTLHALARSMNGREER